MRVLGGVVLYLVVLLVGCGPARMGSLERAYREGRLTEYQYHQLRLQEKMAREADTANYLTIINSGRKR